MLWMPNSWGSSLLEVNRCHGPGKGHPCTSPRDRALKRKEERIRQTPIQVGSIKQAIKLILQGKVVELSDTRRVNTLLKKLAKMAQKAAAMGADAPNFDLCKVSVRNTNLFCAERIRDKEFPQGIPRIRMPQLKGTAEPGSPASKLPVDKKGRVNGQAAFIEYMRSIGIESREESVFSASLKASQRELIGAKVAEMMLRKGKKAPNRKTVFISRDNYVVDGHHHWAAAVGKDAGDKAYGDLRMKAVRFDAPISEVLFLARRWTKKFGIRPVAGLN
jgi:hypothetical protein